MLQKMIDAINDRIAQLKEECDKRAAAIKKAEAAYNVFLSVNPNFRNASIEEEYETFIKLTPEQVIELTRILELDYSSELITALLNIYNNPVFANQQSIRYLKAKEALVKLKENIVMAITGMSFNFEILEENKNELKLLSKYQSYFENDTIKEKIFDIKELASILRKECFGFSDDEIIEMLVLVTANNGRLYKAEETEFQKEYDLSLMEKAASAGVVEEENIPLEVSKPEETYKKPLFKVDTKKIPRFDEFMEMIKSAGIDLYKTTVGNSSKYQIAKNYAKEYFNGNASLEDIRDFLTMPEHYKVLLLEILMSFGNDLDEWLNYETVEEELEEVYSEISKVIDAAYNIYNNYYLPFINESKVDVPEDLMPVLKEDELTGKNILLVHDSRGNIPLLDSFRDAQVDYDTLMKIVNNCYENSRNSKPVRSNNSFTKVKYHDVGTYRLIFFIYNNNMIIYDLLSKNEFDNSTHEYGDSFDKEIEIITKGGPEYRARLQEDKETLRSLVYVRGGGNNE